MYALIGRAVVRAGRWYLRRRLGRRSRSRRVVVAALGGFAALAAALGLGARSRRGATG